MSDQSNFSIIVLAAGKGTRMKSEKAKVLHQVFYAPMLHHVLIAVKPLGADKTVAIIGHQRDEVERSLATFDVELCVQKEQLGTGHAVLCAEPIIGSKTGTVMILCGDTPLIQSESLEQMYRQHLATGGPLTVMTTVLENPMNYGRIISSDAGKVLSIVEEKDATVDQKKIAEIVGREHCTTSLEDLHCYSYDGTKKTFLPEVVAFPDSTDQIAALMRLASSHVFPVVARGAGSGMTGGSLPIKGGMVLALSRLNRILEIDRNNQIAIVEPGVITGEFQQEVKRFGLFYPPDPASLKFCTMGGNAAECAGGPSAVKYGVTKDFIIGLEVVLASGEILTTGTRTEKGVVGYDLTRLFIGSEGTLGIITKIITRLIPLPEHKETFLISSNSLPQATALVAEILNHNINPCTLEYMDRTALSLVAKLLPAPPAPDIQAILLLEIDGSRNAVFEQTECLYMLLNTTPHCTIRQATTDAERQDLWQARRSISPATFQLSPHKISEDVVVPRTRIPELVQFTEKLAQELDLTILTFGHAGDGNIHVNIMLDLDQEEQLRKGEIARERLFRQVIHLAGTLSGEHGIGITKSKFLPLELNDTTLKVMKQLKTLFDPQGILNPGKIFPTETS